MHQHRQMRSWIASSSLSLIRTIPVPVRESKLYCPLWVAFPFSHTNNRFLSVVFPLVHLNERSPFRFASSYRVCHLVMTNHGYVVCGYGEFDDRWISCYTYNGHSKNECDCWLYSCFDYSWLAVFVCFGTFCLLIDMIDFALTQIDSINYSIPLRLLNTLSSPIIASWRYSSISIHHFNRISHSNSP